jgi:elongation factor Ts
MITAQDVNKLRQMTGAGMMDCKKALTESDGDFDKAIDYLRKTGQKLAAKRADRVANQGMTLAAVEPDYRKFASIVLISCETDFVAMSDDFKAFTQDVSALTLEKRPADLEAAKEMLMGDGRPVVEHVTDLIGKIGEKIEFAAYECLEGELVHAYNHFGNKLATLVAFDKVISMEVVADVAMQAAAMSPVALDEASVSEATKEHELEIAREKAREQGQPETKIEMIAQGSLKKFYKEMTLVNQEFIKDNKITVAQYVAKAGAKVTAFKRVQIGG